MQDELLRQEVMQQNGPACWKQIAETVLPNHTSFQCARRWRAVLDPNIVKGPWDPKVMMVYACEPTFSRKMKPSITLCKNTEHADGHGLLRIYQAELLNNVANGITTHRPRIYLILQMAQSSQP